MTAAADKIRSKRARRPIYLTCMRVAVLETGEERLAWVASHPIDARLMKERGWRAGVSLSKWLTTSFIACACRNRSPVTPSIGAQRYCMVITSSSGP